MHGFDVHVQDEYFFLRGRNQKAFFGTLYILPLGIGYVVHIIVKFDTKLNM